MQSDRFTLDAYTPPNPDRYKIIMKDSLRILISLLNILLTSILFYSLKNPLLERKLTPSEFYAFSAIILPSIFAWSLSIGYARSKIEKTPAAPRIELCHRISSMVFLLTVGIVFYFRALQILPGIYYWIVPALYFFYLFFYAYPRGLLFDAGIVLYLIFLSAPYQLDWVELLSPSALILGWLFLHHLVKQWLDEKPSWLTSWLIIPAITLYSICLYSTFTASNPYKSFTTFLQIGSDILFLLVVTDRLQSQRRRWILFVPPLICMLLVSITGILLVIQRWAILGFWSGIFHATWVNNCPPENNAFIVLVLIPLLLAGREQLFHTRWRIVLSIIGLIYSIFLFCTHAWVQWFIFVFEIAFYYLLRMHKVRTELKHLALSYTNTTQSLLALATAPVLLFMDNLMHAFSPGISARFEFWSELLHLIKEHFWFGWGFNATKSYYFASMNPYDFRPLYGDISFDAKNTWLELILSLGVVGFLCVLFFLGILILRLVKLNRTSIGSTPMFDAITTASLAILLDSFLNFRFNTPENSYMIWLIIGMAFWGFRDGVLTYDATNQPPRSSFIYGRFFITLACLPLLGAMVVFGISHNFLNHVLDKSKEVIDFKSRQAYLKTQTSLNLAMKYNPWNAHLYYYYGLMNEEIGYYLQALDYYQEAIKRDPMNDFYHEAVAELLFIMNKPAKSLEYLNRAISLNPNRSNGKNYFGRALVNYQLGRLDKMNEDLLYSLIYNMQLHVAIAGMHYNFEDFPDTKTILDHGLHMLKQKKDFTPEGIDNLVFRLSAVAIANGYTQMAKDYQKHLSVKGHQSIRAAILRSRMYRRDVDTSANMLRDGFKLHKNEPTLKLELGIMYCMAGRFHEARKNLEESINHWDSPVLDNLLGYTYLLTCYRKLYSQASHELYDEIQKTIDIIMYISSYYDHQLWESQQFLSHDLDKVEQVYHYLDLLNNYVLETLKIVPTKFSTFGELVDVGIKRERTSDLLRQQSEY